MTRYNRETLTDNFQYREGVDRVLEYIESIHRYDALLKELRWAIEEQII